MNQSFETTKPSGVHPATASEVKVPCNQWLETQEAVPHM